MKSKITLLYILAIILIVVVYLDPVTADVVWDTSVRHQIEGTTVYNDVDYYEGVSLKMTYDEFVDLAKDRYGEDALHFYESPSYRMDGTMEINENVKWTAVHVKLYDETRDLNGYFVAGFKNELLEWAEAGMLFGCEDFHDFNDKADSLISVNKSIYDGMKSFSHALPEWELRSYENTEENTMADIDLVAPDAIYPAEENGMTTYHIYSYEEGKAGQIHFRYLTNDYSDTAETDGLWEFEDADFLTFRSY